MLGGPLRRCRKIWPIPLFFFSLFCIVLWKRLETIEKPPLDEHFSKTRQEEYVDKRGVHVIVGHYIGNTANKIMSASNDTINTNHFLPEPNAGKNGMPVVLQPKDLLSMQQLFQINKFNLMASDKIPLNRTLPDVRKKKCRHIHKNYEQYPTTSIIIVFHNEAWSTLMRTVWSVIGRSPKSLLKEIILVDDSSERAFLKQPLDHYVSTLPAPTRVLRTKQRVGLVKARMLGARNATGEALTFLDAHCECTEGWLVSLLGRLAEKPKTVVCPVIDIINDDTFAYVKSFELHWGAFNWNLQFRWYTLGGPELKKRSKDATTPFITPTMAGGLFAIKTDYFFALGAYDEGMKVWGGENLEMSFRVWQCGGTIEIVPCSHVGHLFRKSSPYTFPGGISETLYSNLARVALVWMDDWGRFYFKFNSAGRAAKANQDVKSRMQLREKLQCKNFQWYLDTVWPENFFPRKDRFFGKIRNEGNDQCLIKPLGKETSNQPMGLAKLNNCLKEAIFIEMFVMTKDGFIMTDDSVCLDAPEKQVNGLRKSFASPVWPLRCAGVISQRQAGFTKQIIHSTNRLCLDLPPSKQYSEGLIITDCNDSKYQKWSLESIPWQ